MTLNWILKLSGDVADVASSEQINHNKVYFISLLFNSGIIGVKWKKILAASLYLYCVVVVVMGLN